jgi:hypothetical protein
MHPLSPQRRQIIYSDSGAGALKQAAMLRGERLKGLVPYGPMQEAFIGPIDLIAHPFERQIWREANDADTSIWRGLDAESRHKADRAVASWWADLRTNKRPATIWHCSRDVGDVSFLVALLNEIEFEEDTLLIDVADIVSGKGHVTSTGGCRPESILSAADSAVHLDEAKRDKLRKEFARFAASPKGLRLFDTNGVVQEAPIDAHDATILNFISDDWRSYIRVMSDVVKHQIDRDIRDLDYGVLLWRVDKLIEAGVIERRGGSREPLFVENPMMGDLRRVA